MTDVLKLECNIALLPDESLADKLADVSQRLAERHPTIVQLGRAGQRLTLAPHLTLYQVALPVNNLPEAGRRLHQTAAQQPALQDVAATRYAYNEDEASFEVQRGMLDKLLSVQNTVVQEINPLRQGLLVERDPAGNQLSTLLHAPDPLGTNIRRTGYAEVDDPRHGGLFRPHDTLNWFQPGTSVDINAESLPPLQTLRGSYRAIGLFALGPHGTCPQLLAEYPLAASAPPHH